MQAADMVDMHRTMEDRFVKGKNFFFHSMRAINHWPISLQGSCEVVLRERLVNAEIT